jgi:hypothetical protein
MGLKASTDARAVDVLCGHVVLFLALVAVAAGCGSTRTSPTSHVVSVSGRIGPLQIDKSDRRAVIAFAGRPQWEGHGRMPSFAAYDSLGYSCSATATPDNYPLAPGRPYCETVFWINERTGRMEAFFTGAAGYVESHGVRVGMATATAERLLHKRLLAGCDEDIYLSSPTADLTVAFAGGRVPLPKRHVVGGHVSALVLHSKHDQSGVFDCE